MQIYSRRDPFVVPLITRGGEVNRSSPATLRPTDPVIADATTPPLEIAHAVKFKALKDKSVEEVSLVLRRVATSNSASVRFISDAISSRICDGRAVNNSWTLLVSRPNQVWQARESFLSKRYHFVRSK